MGGDSADGQLLIVMRADVIPGSGEQLCACGMAVGMEGPGQLDQQLLQTQGRHFFPFGLMPADFFDNGVEGRPDASAVLQDREALLIAEEGINDGNGQAQMVQVNIGRPFNSAQPQDHDLTGLRALAFYSYRDVPAEHGDTLHIQGADSLVTGDLSPPGGKQQDNVFFRACRNLQR